MNVWVALALPAAVAGPPAQVPEEILVTAQRRPEGLQDVPVSALVVSGQSLVVHDQEDLETLALTLPGVHVGSNGPSNDLYIRGIGSGGNQAFDQSVAVFEDDVYRGKSRTTLASFLDLDRVEVLRGPQSTFFGNNAIAGAINLVSRRPSKNVEGAARGSYGSYGERAIEGVISGPLRDGFSARAAAGYGSLDGWLENVVSGETVPEETSVAGRLTLDFAPDADLDATLKVEGSSYRESGALQLQLANCPPASPFTTGAFCGLAAATGVPTYFIGELGNQTAEDPLQKNELKTFDNALTVTFRQADHVFTSVSAYDSYRYQLDLDLDGIPPVLASIRAPEDYQQFSQELRVASPTDLAVEYLAGLYYQWDRYKFQDGTNFSYLSPLITDPDLGPYLPLGQSLEYVQDQRTYSAFAAATWHATERLRLGVGLRGSRVTKDYDRTLFTGTATADFGIPVRLPPDVIQAGDAVLGAPSGELHGGRSDQDWMPSVRIQYMARPATMLYLSYSDGFKAGGFNGEDTTGLAENLPYKPESVDAYEAGIKTGLGDHRASLNVALFRSDYADLQVTAFQPPPGDPAGPNVAVVDNAARSRSQGVEASLQWASDSGPSLSADVSYLDSRYIKYPRAGATAIQRLEGRQFQDLSGRPTEYAPRWSGRLVVAQAVPLPDDLQLILEASPYFSSSYFISYEDDEAMKQPGFMRLDARATLEGPARHWAVDLIGENLTDRQVLDLAVVYPSSLGSYLAARAQPRSLAAQLRYRW